MSHINDDLNVLDNIELQQHTSKDIKASHSRTYSISDNIVPYISSLFGIAGSVRRGQSSPYLRQR